MSAQRVTVTYSGPIVFLSTDHWKQIQASLASQFPLRNLHWKSTSRNAVRSIQELDVKLVPFETLKEDQAASQVPQTVLEKPLLHLYIFTCEDSEVYRSTVRKQLKEWHASASTRKNQEWLIVHVMRPDQSVGQGRLFQIKTSVLDKVKADFNLDKKDRYVQLVWSAEKDNPTVWADFISKVKDGVLSSFDAALVQREEEMKRSEGQRTMPGWNFCTFFILKASRVESVASSLEGMNLHEDALQQYYELEYLFFQVLREKNLSWFGALITPMPTDDSVPLLSITKKPYRDLILANTISVFDFRVYLLARQCLLLSKMGDMEELCRKAASFLSIFSRTLREVENTLPPFFIESWIYSSSLSVVDQADEWAKKITLEKAAQSSFNAAKAELLELARHQRGRSPLIHDKLDILGIATGFLPNKPPFSLMLPSSFDLAAKDPKAKRGSMTITKTELLTSMEQQDTLYDLYVNVTNRAIELYANSGRRKFALKLHGSLAALDIHRGRLANALQTYTSLPAHYSPHGWTSMEAYMLNRALNIHDAAERAKDREWIHILLHFLRAYVEDGGRDLLLSEEDNKAYVEGLIAALKEAARNLDNDVPFPDHPALSVSLVDPHTRLAESRDGSLLTVAVHNKLPCDVPAEEVRLQLNGRDSSQFTFTAKVTGIISGRTELTLFCPSPAMGTFTLASTQISVSRLLFQWKHTKTPKQIKAGNMPKLVYIPKDARALDVKLKQPPLIELGTTSRIRVVLSTGRNEIATAAVKLGAPSGISFRCEEAELMGDDPPAIRFDAESLTFLDLKAGQTVVAAVPHSDASAYAYMRVNITVDYVTTAEPDIPRILRLSRVVATGLPVEINVQDFFRGTRPAFYRVHLVDKDTPACSSALGTVVVAGPDHGREARDGLKLQITYRMLREEVEALIELAVSEVSSKTPSLDSFRQDMIDKLVQALELEASWVELYGITGELVVPGITPTDDEVGSGLRQVMETLNQRRSAMSFGEWRDIVIPVDVPQIHILASARLQILENPFSSEMEAVEKRTRPLYAGQPISALLTVNTSFHWAPPEDVKVQRYNMRYDIEDLTQDWLVSGRKRGDFVAKVSFLPMALIGC
ncbi:hypothetical protein GSI_13900 [Ganoderma sinense ZZ0214-1]|uniref:Trafficking protein particle complex subunit 11 domain-containing protein n=1 Tax=Ganoderma sinense ZZ0214-1 TaxID=1077348 RepID=A0A2G8RRL2_9APHY|nr:hypothetical protein GSI_13900 [Ganoderma sinense ZZ0214-1]